MQGSLYLALLTVGLAGCVQSDNHHRDPLRETRSVDAEGRVRINATYRGAELNLVGGIGVTNRDVPCKIWQGLGVPGINCSRNLFLSFDLGDGLVLYYNSHLRNLDRPFGPGFLWSGKELLDWGSEESPDDIVFFRDTGFIQRFDIKVSLSNGSEVWFDDMNNRVLSTGHVLYDNGAYDSAFAASRKPEASPSYPKRRTWKLEWREAMTRRPARYSSGTASGVGKPYTVKFEYDDRDRLIAIKSDDNDGIYFAYDDSDRLVSVDENGRVTVFGYDGDFLESIGYDDAPSMSFTSSSQFFTMTVGDDAGTKIVTEQEFREFNGVPRLVSLAESTYQEGVQIGFRKTTTFQRHSDGRPEFVVENGIRTNYSYKGDTWLLSKIEESGNASAKVDVTYNDNYWPSEVTSGNGLRREVFEYDDIWNDQAFYRRLRVSGPSGSGTLTKITWSPLRNATIGNIEESTGAYRAYDGLGNLTTSRDLAGCLTNIYYDKMARPTSRKDCDGNVTSYEYDDDTLELTKVTYPDGRVQTLKERHVELGNGGLERESAIAWKNATGLTVVGTTKAAFNAHGALDNLSTTYESANFDRALEFKRLSSQEIEATVDGRLLQVIREGVSKKSPFPLPIAEEE